MSITKIEQRYITAKYTILNRIVKFCVNSNEHRKNKNYESEKICDYIIHELSEIYRDIFKDSLSFKMGGGYYHFIETDDYKILIEKGK